MVEAFFDKAANHTDISKDRLDFYKKSESLVKLHLTLKRGKSLNIQITDWLKPFLHIGVNTKLTNYLVKEEQDSHPMLPLKKLKP